MSTEEKVISDAELPLKREDNDERCPWCGARQEDLWERGDDLECSSCGRAFSKETVCSYILRPVETVKCDRCTDGKMADGSRCCICYGQGVREKTWPYNSPLAKSCPECDGTGRACSFRGSPCRTYHPYEKCRRCEGSGRATPIRKVGDCAEEIEESDEAEESSVSERATS